MMDKMIADFPAQLKEAMAIGEKIKLREHDSPINKAIILGMGGSGIGGDFVSSFVNKECRVPIIPNKSYDLPGWVDENTLIIASSYSGNTEETVSALKQALSIGSKIVCVSSGGKLSQIASENSLDFVKLPSGMSSPRACLGYSVVQQIYILVESGLIGSSITDNIKSASDLLKYDQDGIKDTARNIAEGIYNKTPVIYCSDAIEPVAIRWRQQINENSKYLAWHHVVPEMNHNELVGWKKERTDVAVIVLRNRDDHIRTSHRIEICSEVIDGLSGYYHEIQSKGNSILEKSMYLVHIGDWVSFYLADLYKVDPVEIEVIDNLKRELGKL